VKRKPNELRAARDVRTDSAVAVYKCSSKCCFCKLLLKSLAFVSDSVLFIHIFPDCCSTRVKTVPVFVRGFAKTVRV
jgi:hypothetical protein